VAPGPNLGQEIAAAMNAKYPEYKPGPMDWEKGGLVRVDRGSSSPGATCQPRLAGGSSERESRRWRAPWSCADKQGYTRGHDETATRRRRLSLPTSDLPPLHRRRVDRFHKRRDLREPAIRDTRDVIGPIPGGTPADAAMAIRAAESAFPGWSRTPARSRGEILYRFGALMAEHKERRRRR